MAYESKSKKEAGKDAKPYDKIQKKKLKEWKKEMKGEWQAGKPGVKTFGEAGL